MRKAGTAIVVMTLVAAGVPALAQQPAPAAAAELMVADAMQGPGAGGAGRAQQGPAYTAPKTEKIPAADPYVADVLKDPTLHAQWEDIKGPNGKTIKGWVVYPRRSDKAGVVIVIHEIFGLTDWVRGVANELAAEGFIAIAPDMVSGMGPNGGGSAELGTGVNQAISSLTPQARADILNAVMAYGKSIPSSNGKTGVVGFCWGGGSSLLYAIAQPSLDAAVMYYGPGPTKPGTQEVDLSGLPSIKAPILAMYPSTDNRTLSTAEPISNEMKRLGKSFEYHVYDGATHGFMHQRSEADYKAAQQSWPLVTQFFTAKLK